MTSGEQKNKGARAIIDRAISDLIENNKHITPVQLGRILRESIPVSLIVFALVSFLSLLATVFGLGWKGHSLFISREGQNSLPSSMVAAVPVPLLSPTDTVYRYFVLLDQGNHEAAWQMIAPPGDGKIPDYEHWIDWWNKVSKVSVRELAILSESPFQAVLRYRLEYKMKDGRDTLDKPSRAVLVREAKEKPWKIFRLER